jgi:hypothetical protein
MILVLLVAMVLVGLLMGAIGSLMERVNMVFAVEVRIPNPDHALKPGVPADAEIMTGE